MTLHDKPLKQLRAELFNTSDLDSHFAAKGVLQERLGVAGLAAELAPGLTHVEAAVRYNSACALRDLGPASAHQAAALARALNDVDPNVRQAAAHALGSMGPAGATHGGAIMQASLRAGQDSEVRVACVGALKELNLHTTHDSEQLRELTLPAISGLGQFAKPHAARLAGQMRDPDPLVRQAAAYALGALGTAGEPYSAEIEAVMREPATSAGRALPQQQPKEEEARYDESNVNFLSGPWPPQDPATELRCVAMGITPHAAKLAEALGSEDSQVRQAAASGLRALGRAAAPYGAQLGRALKDSDCIVRQTAAWALGGIGLAARPFAKELAQAMGDQDPDVRVAAAATVLELGQLDPTLEIFVGKAVLACQQ